MKKILILILGLLLIGVIPVTAQIFPQSKNKIHKANKIPTRLNYKKRNLNRDFSKRSKIVNDEFEIVSNEMTYYGLTQKELKKAIGKKYYVVYIPKNDSLSANAYSVFDLCPEIFASYFFDNDGFCCKVNFFIKLPNLLYVDNRIKYISKLLGEKYAKVSDTEWTCEDKDKGCKLHIKLSDLSKDYMLMLTYSYIKTDENKV